MESNALDRLLKAQGLNYEDLNPEEKLTYNKSSFNLQKLTVSDVKNYVSDMKNSIALQLTDTPEESVAVRHILSARLKNYILLEAFLVRPEKAEEALNRQLEMSKGA